MGGSCLSVKSNMILLVLSILIILGVATSYYYGYLSYLNTIYTTTTQIVNPPLINLELKVSKDEDVKVFRNIATIAVDDVDALLFRIASSKIEGLSSISLSGRVRLESSDKSYIIDMPCILHLNTSCSRILSIIPGYDAPLNIEAGKYNLTIEFSWRESKGYGKIHLSLFTKAYDVVLIYLGSHTPENTSEWITAEDSTRSYALLVDRTKTTVDDSGFGKFTALVWVFKPLDEKPQIFKFKLTSYPLGQEKAFLELTVERQGVYYQALVLIKARPGEYELSIIEPVSLSIFLEVEDK